MVRLFLSCWSTQDVLRLRHIEKRDSAFWIIGHSGKLNALCCVHAVHVRSSIARHLLIPTPAKRHSESKSRVSRLFRTAKKAPDQGEIIRGLSWVAYRGSDIPRQREARAQFLPDDKI